MQDLILTAVGTMATALVSKVGEDAYTALKRFLSDKLGLERAVETFERQPDHAQNQMWLADDLKEALVADHGEFEALVKAIQSELKKKDVSHQAALKITAKEGAFIKHGDVDIEGSAGVHIKASKKAKIKTGHIRVKS